ncbi:MAG: adenosylcobinamide-GDP ribazoletransferase [Shimia sp.]
MPDPLHDVAAAIGLLTRLPVPVDAARAMARGGRAAWAYPLAGLVVGGAMALVAALAAGLGPGLSAGIALTAGVVLTGALHEDGLADCADGFWGGHDRTRRLEIMRDSRIGAYGVLALVLGGLLRWQAMAACLAAGPVWLLLAPVVSRAAMVPVMQTLPSVRRGGLSASVGRPGRTATWGALGVAVVVVLAFGAVGLAVLATAALAAIACASIARAKIGGQTGDVLGATQQVTEIATLLCLAALLGP